MTSLRDSGKRGAQARNKNLSSSDRSEAAKKAAKTRKERDPDAFSKMGQKGGSRSHGSGGSSRS